MFELPGAAQGGQVERLGSGEDQVGKMSLTEALGSLPHAPRRPRRTTARRISGLRNRSRPGYGRQARGEAGRRGDHAQGVPRLQLGKSEGTWRRRRDGLGGRVGAALPGQ